MNGVKRKETTAVAVRADGKKKAPAQLSVVSLLQTMADDSEFFKKSLTQLCKTDLEKNMTLFNISQILMSIKAQMSSGVKPKGGGALKFDKYSKQWYRDMNGSIRGMAGILTSILGAVKNIASKLSGKKGGGSGGADVNSLQSLANVAERLAGVLDTKTNRALKQFLRIITKYSSKKNINNIKALGAAFKPLGDAFDTIAKGAVELDKQLKVAMKGITLFAIFLNSPLFEKATDKLTAFFSALHSKSKTVTKTKTLNKQTDYKYIFFSLALGIAAICGALYMLKTVDWRLTLALLGFLGALSFFAFLATRNMKGRSVVKNSNNTNSFNKTTNNNNMRAGLLGIAMGLAILVLSIYAIKDIDWKAALTLVLFLAAIQTILVASKIIVGKKGGDGGSGMLGFAFGFGLLILAIAASRELFQQDPVMKKIFGYSMPVDPMWGIVGWILAVSLAVMISQMKGGKNQMLQFSIGIAILVLTIFAWYEIVTHCPNIYVHALLFAGVILIFGIILRFISGGNTKLFGKGYKPSKNTLIFIGEVTLVALVGAFIIRILDGVKSGFGDLLGRVIILVGMLFLITLFIQTFPKMMKGIKRPQLQSDLILLGIVAAGGLVIVTVLSLLPVSGEELLFRALVMVGTLAIIAAGIVVFGKIMKPKDAAIGAAIMAGIVIVMGIAILAIKPLIEAKPEGDLWEKAYVLWSTIGVITGGVLALGLLMLIPGFNLAVAAGAGVMLAVSLTMLAAGKGLFYIASCKTEGLEDKVNTFTSSFKKIANTIADLGFLKMVKAGATAVAALPVFSCALKMAQTIKNLADVEYDATKIDNFCNQTISFVTTFIDKLGESSDEGLEKIQNSSFGLFNIINTAKGFVDVLIAIAKGQVPRYEVKDGQAVLVAMDKFDIDSISKTAGEKLAQLMVGFINAFGKLELTPAQTLKLMLIGGTFEKINPIIDSAASLLGNMNAVATLQDDKKMTSVTNNISNFVTSLIDSISSIDMILFSGSKLDSFSEFIKQMGETKWDNISKGTEKAAKGIDKVVTSINKLKLDKSISLRNTIKAFTDVERMAKVDEQLTKIVKIIEGINDAQSTLERISVEGQTKLEQTKEQVRQTREAITKASSKGMSEEWFAKTVFPMIVAIQSSIEELGDGLDVTIKGIPKVKLQQE